MEVKNKKIFYKPIKMISQNNVIIMWDYKSIVKTNDKGDYIESPLGVWQEHKFNHIPSLNEIKEVIFEYYNNITENEIVTGFYWNDIPVWLSMENQFNYKSVYDLTIQTNGKNLPIKFKFGDNNNVIYYTFENIEDFTDFYFNMINHIKKCIEKGWEKKDSINWDFYDLNHIYIK